MMTISNGLTNIKNFIARDIAYATYRSGSSWTQISIHDIKILSDGRLGIYIFFDENCPDTITGIRLYDNDGTIWAQNTDITLTKESYPAGIMYWFTIRIVQEEDE